jgi:curved DNA-binding protein
MEFKDYYKIMDVDAGASDKEIKTAYRKLARKYHPEVSDLDDASDRFKEVAEAYEVLKDKEKRAEYDEILQYGVHGKSFQPPPGWQPGGAGGDSRDDSAFSDFFSSIFGHASQQSGSDQSARGGEGFYRGDWADQTSAAQRGQDIETELPIFLEDTLSKATKEVAYQIAGAEKTLKVKIPVGINNGERIRLKGQGLAGREGAPSGDLYLRIRLVPHPLYDVEGHNLVITLPLTPWEAVLGTKVSVPTLQGKVLLTIPPNCQSGKRLRVKGKGLANKLGGIGDLYVVFKIVVPQINSASDKEHWQQLAKNTTFDPRAEWSKSS